MPDLIDFNFKVYYGVLPSEDIVNVLINPEKPEEYINKVNKINKFYDKLEASIIKEGFRNPILINCGLCYSLRVPWLPKEIRYDQTNKLICDKCGGSRLYIAKKLKLQIPCIISDFCNYFENKNFTRIETIDEIYKYFKDPPSNIRLMEHGVHFTALKHIHLL